MGCIVDKKNLPLFLHIFFFFDISLHCLGETARKIAREMKRRVQSVARTINLAEPKTCARPTKLEKLVTEEQLNSVKSCANTYNSPRPVSVRVCSRRILESTCSAKVILLLTFVNFLIESLTLPQ